MPAGRLGLIPLLAAAALALVACSPTGQEATQEPAEAASAPAATAADDADADVTAATDPTDVPEAQATGAVEPAEPTEDAGPEASPAAEDALLACDDLADRTDWAFIVTEAPAAGEPVASGFHARGCANVFEAALSWRLVSGLDEPIAEGFGMASCGTGCVGTFDLIVEYPARDEPEIGYLEVFASSPEDGRPIHVNRIPLILE